MLQRLKNRTHGDEGFTLVELLVVILIIGILAAIALPTFLGQSSKAQDSEAKSNARNAVSQVESCFSTKQDYTQCTNSDLKGLDAGTGDGQVTISGQAKSTGYTATAKSKSGNTFIITKTGNGLARSCSTTGGTAEGGCNGSGW